VGEDGSGKGGYGKFRTNIVFKEKELIAGSSGFSPERRMENNQEQSARMNVVWGI